MGYELNNSIYEKLIYDVTKSGVVPGLTSVSQQEMESMFNIELEQDKDNEPSLLLENGLLNLPVVKLIGRPVLSHSSKNKKNNKKKKSVAVR